MVLEQDSPRSINSREKKSRNLLVPTFVFQCCSVGVGGEDEDKVVQFVLLLQSSFLKVQVSNCLL